MDKDMRVIEELNPEQLLDLLVFLNTLICILLILAGIIIGLALSDIKYKKIIKKIRRKMKQLTKPKETYVVKEENEVEIVDDE